MGTPEGIICGGTASGGEELSTATVAAAVPGYAEASGRSQSLVRAAATVLSVAAATAVTTAAAAAAATTAAVTVAVTATVIVTVAATATVTAAAVATAAATAVVAAITAATATAATVSRLAARELGSYNPGPEDDGVQRGRTRAETVRHREAAADPDGDDVQLGRTRGETARHRGAAGHGLLSLMAAREGIGHVFFTKPRRTIVPLFPHAWRASFQRQTRMLKHVRMSIRLFEGRRWKRSTVDWRARKRLGRCSNQTD